MGGIGTLTESTFGGQFELLPLRSLSDSIPVPRAYAAYIAGVLINVVGFVGASMDASLVSYGMV
jgi:hypothetical protein